MKKNNVVNCMFSHWYPTFKHTTISSLIVDLPDPVMEYLISDGLVLPGDEEGSSTDRANLAGDSDDEIDWISDTTDAVGVKCPTFPEFEATVNQYIEKLGGVVFPKLDWSSPKDAVWVTFGHTLKCKNIRDIFLLLKSSDFVTHDLNEPFDSCQDSLVDSDGRDSVRHLVLREWHDISPDCEFRCFVRNNSIIAISSRHLEVYYPSAVKYKQKLCDDIVKFFDKNIKYKFFDTDFTFDVWCRDADDVMLIDFNPFGPVTDALLYTWDELADDKLALELRCIETKEGIQPNPYRFYAVPQDFVHLSAGIDPVKFCDLMKLKVQDPNDPDVDSD